MEPLCGAAVHPPLHLPLSPNHLLSSPPILPHIKLSSSSFKTPLSLRVSSSKSSSSPMTASVAAAAAAAAAALFLARLAPPALAATAFPSAPAAQSEALPSENAPVTDAEKERILEEDLESHPYDVRSLRSLMEIKVKTGKLAEAVDIIDRLTVLEPGEKDFPLLKAHLQSHSGDPETARLGFEQLIEKNPFLVEAYHGLVMAAMHSSEEDAELDRILKRVEDALALSKEARRKDDVRDFKLLKAQIRIIEGNYEDSLKIYQQLVEEEPRDFRPYLCQGIIYTMLRKKDEAEKQFEKFRRLVPKGHPYASFFNDSMIAMKVFGEMDNKKSKASLKN